MSNPKTDEEYIPDHLMRQARAAVGLGSIVEALQQNPNAPCQEILKEASDLIVGARNKDYGDAVENFTNVADGWSIVFGKPVTARQVCQAMIWLKVCRDINAPTRDSLVDICGYAALAHRCE